MELFTHHGIGTMVTLETADRIRDAKSSDVDGILGLIDPLTERGILVARSRASIEAGIERFVVLAHDNEVIGCAELIAYPGEKKAELACLAVNPFYRDGGRGERLLHFIEKRAKERGFKTLFVLSTQTTQWFVERGFLEAEVTLLPAEKRAKYSQERNSKVYTRTL